MVDEARRDLDAWIGRTREARDRITLARTRKLAATLDLDAESLVEGGPLPHGWHWIYFHEAVPRSALGEDGHERRGDFLPPVPLDRRMWASGTLRFLRPLRIGEEVTRISTIRSVEEKVGRAGPLVFVTVEHRIHDSGGVALEEEQDLVYLNRRMEDGGRKRPVGPSSTTALQTPDARWRESFTADEVTLFRFSALTFNGHRIHYDRRYAVDVEGYPDIVAHGPLLALLLLGAGVRWASETTDVTVDAEAPLTFSYRARRPVFCGQTVELRGSPSGHPDRAVDQTSSTGDANGLELQVRGPDGYTAMQAELSAGT